MVGTNNAQKMHIVCAYDMHFLHIISEIKRALFRAQHFNGFDSPYALETSL